MLSRQDISELSSHTSSEKMSSHFSHTSETRFVGGIDIMHVGITNILDIIDTFKLGSNCLIEHLRGLLEFVEGAKSRQL